MHVVKILGIIFLAVYLILNVIVTFIGFPGDVFVTILGGIAGVLLLISIGCFSCSHKPSRH